MGLSGALEVLKFMQKGKIIDQDIYELIINSRIFNDYACKEMTAAQNDIEYER